MKALLKINAVFLLLVTTINGFSQPIRNSHWVYIDGIKVKLDSNQIKLITPFFSLPKENFVTVKSEQKLSGIISSICKGGYTHHIGYFNSAVSLQVNDSTNYLLILESPLDSMDFNHFVNRHAEILVRPYAPSDSLINSKGSFHCLHYSGQIIGIASSIQKINYSLK